MSSQAQRNYDAQEHPDYFAASIPDEMDDALNCCGQPPVWRPFKGEEPAAIVCRNAHCGRCVEVRLNDIGKVVEDWNREVRIAECEAHSWLSVQPPANLAHEYLKQHRQTVKDWDGACGELADAVIAGLDSDIIYVELPEDAAWRYHMVPLIGGFIHDAWRGLVALPIKDWLKLWGDSDVTVSLNGDDIYEGPANEFESARVQSPPFVCCHCSAILGVDV